MRSVRRDPNVLLPGDRLVIPDRTVKEVSRQTERKHRFIRKGEPTFLPIQILDNNRPLARKPYTVSIDGRMFSGTTDDQGILRLRIAGNARHAVLVVGEASEAREYHVALGGVDPLDCVRGVQQRLVNLGYEEVSVTGKMDEATRRALASFQAANDLSPTGELDDRTLARLREKHGH